MRLQGYSSSWYETNYLITHFFLFATAQESADMFDSTNHSSAIGVGGRSLTFLYETGQEKLVGYSLGNLIYTLKNSSIFYVDKINTPLLIMHNRKDNIVPFIQAKELFTALRRLHKPIWMLQYDREGHILGDPAYQLDFTIRQQQFFDHYLKNIPILEWMKKDIFITLKGVRSGIELNNKH